MMWDVIDFKPNRRNYLPSFTDRFFDDPFFNGIMERTEWKPSVDVEERENDFVITADMPGLAKEDIKVNVENRVLYIIGSRKSEKEDKKKNYHYRERVCGTFTRSFALPENTDSEHIDAEYKDGVLSLTVKKLEAKKDAKEIAIK